MDSETIVRRASYGLELVDALTRAPLVGASSVVATPDGGNADAPSIVPFLVRDSRYAFEGQHGELLINIRAEYYLPRQLLTGVDLPSVAPAGSPGILAEIALVPRTGYPFPGSLTRVVGAVRLDTNDRPLVAGAAVQLTPHYALGPAVSGPSITTETAADGQYVMWFQPALDAANPALPALPVAISVSVSMPPNLSGMLDQVPIVPGISNGVPTIFIA